MSDDGCIRCGRDLRGLCADIVRAGREGDSCSETYDRLLTDTVLDSCALAARIIHES